IPTVGALGGVEGGLIATLVALKVDVGTAVAITALERGISLVFSTGAGGLAVFALGGGELWRRLRAAPAIDDDQRESREHRDRKPPAVSVHRRAGDQPAAGHVKERDASTERPARRTVLVVCGNGPDPITLRKIEALAASGACDVHLVYWRDSVSLRSYPFSVAIPESSVHPIDLPDPNGPPLRGLILLIRFHLRMMAVVASVRPAVVHAVNF